jgi:DNA polymerase-3 subunit epsilon
MGKRPIFYDTETTGVKSDKDRIIEIAAYDPILDKSYVSLINPQMSIPKESTMIHNITDEMVKDAKTFTEIGKEFAEFCSGDVVLIAHNNDAFDKLFLEAEFKRSNLLIPEWNYLDSLKWARKYRPDLPRHSLQHLREVYNIEANQAHRALDDVIILHKVFSFMIGDLSMETALELMKVESAIRHMPFGKYKGSLLQEVPAHYIKWLSENGALDKPDNDGLKKSLEKLGLLKQLLEAKLTQ